MKFTDCLVGYSQKLSHFDHFLIVVFLVISVLEARPQEGAR